MGAFSLRKMIFHFNNYRNFIQYWIDNCEQKRGVNSRISEAIECHTSYFSQVLSNKKDLTLEQSLKLSHFMGLDKLSEKFLITLVSLERAGDFKLKQHFQEELGNLQLEGLKLQNQLNAKKELSKEAASKYYSDSDYSLVRIICSFPEVKTKSDILDRLRMNSDKLDIVLEFLLSEQLIKEINAELQHTDVSTHIASDSPFVNLHHRNWRIKALARHESKKTNDLFYTGPMSLSEKDIPKVKLILEESLKKIYKVIEPSPAEVVSCLNIDWFQISSKDKNEII